MRYINLMTMIAILAVGTAGITTAVMNIPATEAKQDICRETVDQTLCINKKTGERTNEVCLPGGDICSTEESTHEKDFSKELYKGLKDDCKEGFGTCETSNS